MKPKSVKRAKTNLENAIAGGLMGAALGAVVTGKGKDTLVSALVGAAIGASINAIDEANKINQPVMYEENGTIFRLYPDGRKKIIRHVRKLQRHIPKNFNIG